MTGAFEAFAVSTGAVALGEIGDKTQLLALLLAARWKKPLPIIAGIFVATLANHALAAALGGWLAATVSPQALRWVLGLSFLAVAAWMLVPDRIDADQPQRELRGPGVFALTTIAFFVAEMGDKTQVATVMLAARFESLLAVTAGTTLGMLIANVPAVLAGERLVSRLPVKWVHRAAALIFATLGIWLLWGIIVP